MLGYGDDFVTPNFTLTVGDTDYTNVIRDRLLEIRLTDVNGDRSDYLEITLDDRETIIRPEHGASLLFSLGYNETGLYKKGIYGHDKTEYSGPPKTMIITATSVNFRKSLKSTRTRSFTDITLSDLVTTIASDHGYQYRVDEFLATIHIPHLFQTAETDLHLLTRLANQYDASFKVQGNMLLFMSKGLHTKEEYKDILPTFTLAPGDISRWNVSRKDRMRYGSVVASWYDGNAAKTMKETAGSGEPVHELTFKYPTAQEAAVAAQSKLNQFNRAQATVSLTLPGNPKLVAEGGLILQDFRDGVDGEYTITRVEHILNKTIGYQCQVEAELTL